MANKNAYNIPFIIEQDQDGFFAFAPGLQGCYTQGNTYEEAMANLKEAIRGHLLDRLSSREKLPQMGKTFVSLANLEVAI